MRSNFLVYLRRMKFKLLPSSIALFLVLVADVAKHVELAAQKSTRLTRFPLDHPKTRNLIDCSVASTRFLL